jgi:hypothetical protein
VDLYDLLRMGRLGDRSEAGCRGQTNDQLLTRKCCACLTASVRDRREYLFGTVVASTLGAGGCLGGEAVAVPEGGGPDG